MKKTVHFLLFCFFTAGITAQDRDINYMSSGGKLNPIQANMDIRHYTLSLDVDIANQAITGYAVIDLILLQPTDTILFDLVHFLNVTKITEAKKKKTFYRDRDFIYVVDAGGFKAGRQSIKIEYNGKPPVAVKPPWEGGFSWKKDSTGNPWVSINCQLQGAKVYFPCKDHPSDEPNEGVDMFITVPRGLTVAGPGLLQSVSSKSNKKTFHWKTNYTISNYCIVFDIGQYVIIKRTYTTIKGNKVPMEFYVLEEDKSNAQKVLDLRERDSRILEKYFGEYPWVKEKIGIAEVPNSGMEHQTMVTYGGKFNYKKVCTMDYSSNLFHEFTHEWFANKVTNKDWAHIWIQEGITTYAEALFCREACGEGGYDSMMVKFKRSIKNKKPVVQGDEMDLKSAYYGSDVYTKGAFFMHTLRYVLGDALFFPTLKKLATDPQYTYSNLVTTDDVEHLFSNESGKDMKPLFDFYLRTTKKLEIAINQTGYNEYAVTSTNLPMPLDIDVLTDTGIQRITLSDKDKGVKIISSFTPVVDPKGYYLKNVTSE
ncbi:M1 family metallopeptidase [Ginsengibacter hankyongi]|uniref:Aminopeptidase N n=1 Tax=Ginsengibacter hankyongi TaxID=2607284 RepID=A0A5J5IDS1_9BACT|nr:M1 family metallopeptidase [Ginsengibacter hankyongi]KAA9036096.1 M1 family metallopeptidase [Ginsengibacter hankyongi]